MMKKIIQNYSYIILLVLLSSLLMVVLSNTIEDRSEEKYLMITVESGDSLWSISNRYANEHKMSFEDFLQWVEKKNDLNSSVIYAGDTIIIPVKKEFTTETQYASVNEL